MIIDFPKKNEQEYEEVDGLTKEELEEFNPIIVNIIKNVCLFADKYNYDRDNILEYLTISLTKLSEIGTIKNLNVEGYEYDRD